MDKPSGQSTNFSEVIHGTEPEPTVEGVLKEISRLTRMQAQLLEVLATILTTKLKDTYLREKRRIELRPVLLQLVKRLAEKNNWMIPEELANSIGISQSTVRYRYLPELHRLGFVLRQPNPVRSRSKKKDYMYKLNLEGLPEEVKALISL